MKLNIKEFRQYKDKVIEIFEKDGFDKVNIYCIISSINLTAMFTFLKEHSSDSNNNENNEDYGNYDDEIKDLLEFYGYDDVIG